MQIAHKTKQQALAVLKVWEANDVLSEGSFWSNDDETERVVLNEAKIAEILSRLHRTRARRMIPRPTMRPTIDPRSTHDVRSWVNPLTT